MCCLPAILFYRMPLFRDDEDRPRKQQSSARISRLSETAAAHAHADAMARGADCKRCPLYGLRVGPVPSTIPKNPRLIIIGEAPGGLEVEVGENFSGPSGRILNESLESGGLNRSDCTI